MPSFMRIPFTLPPPRLRSFLPALLLVALFGSTPSQALEVAAYYPAWRMDELSPYQIDFETIDEVRHAFAWPDVFGNLVLDNGIPSPDLVDYAHASGTDVLLSLGGSNQSTFFASTLSDSQRRGQLIAQTVAFCQAYDYDGVDIDWEFPASAYDRANLTLFVQELHAAFTNAGSYFRITMAVPASPHLQTYYDLAAMAPYIHRFSLMTYDFSGWDGVAGHNAPLYAGYDAACNQGTVTETVDHVLDDLGVDPSTVQMGLPFYGRRFSADWLCDSTEVNDYLAFSEVNELRSFGWSSIFDPQAKVPVLRSPQHDQVVSYDDSSSLVEKLAWAEQRGVAGVMIWALGLDVIDGEQRMMQVVANRVSVDGPGRHEALPDRFALDPPRPNPFNPVTTIGFALPEPERVAVDVYSVEGRRLQRLFQGVKPAGRHELEWTAREIASGVYIIVLSGERGRTVAAKAVLMK